MLHQGGASGSIAWDSVTVEAHRRLDVPLEVGNNHYFAARMTSSTPLRVKTPAGEEQEKFLFYRGVSTFSGPLSATPDAAGKLRIKNYGEQEIPTTILFERRGGKVGYRIGGFTQGGAAPGAPGL